MGVLHLADKWGFTALYQAAREAIPPLASSVDMIVLGKKYNLDDWLAPAFVDLIARDDSLTLQEGEHRDWNELLHTSIVSREDLTFVTWKRNQGLERFSKSFLDMVTATRFTRYIIESRLVDDQVLSKVIFRGFWKKMEQLFNPLWAVALPGLNARFMTIITLIGRSVFIADPAVEHFYAECETLMKCHVWGLNHAKHVEIQKHAYSDVRV
jgi:hypothetical protein